MRIFVFLAIILFSGCAIKERVVYKDVFVPIKCDAKMPKSPKNDGSFASHKKIMIYFLECEHLLKYCIGEKND